MNKQPRVWKGSPILDSKHQRQLELAAAINEFHHGHDRDTAERIALEQYRKDHHARAAAFHLNGMKAANASGSHEDAQKHYGMYAQHMKALGFEEHDAVPAEVQVHLDEGKEGRHIFRGHPADQFLVEQVKQPAP